MATAVKFHRFIILRIIHRNTCALGRDFKWLLLANFVKCAQFQTRNLRARHPSTRCFSGMRIKRWEPTTSFDPQLSSLRPSGSSAVFLRPAVDSRLLTSGLGRNRSPSSSGGLIESEKREGCKTGNKMLRLFPHRRRSWRNYHEVWCSKLLRF